MAVQPLSQSLLDCWLVLG